MHDGPRVLMLTVTQISHLNRIVMPDGEESSDGESEEDDNHESSDAS